MDAFIKNQFEDPTRARKADVRILMIKQGKQPIAEYIRELCILVACVKGWPEHMLVYHY